MGRLSIYALLILTVAGSCLFEYWAVRLLNSLPAGTQSRAITAALGACALVIAIFPGSIVATNCLVLVLALVPERFWAGRSVRLAPSRSCLSSPRLWT